MSNYQAFKERMTEAAKRYALSEKADPFVFNRCMTHIKNGIAGFRKDGEDAFYDAEETTETRHLPNGEAYTVPAWKNIKRV